MPYRHNGRRVALTAPTLTTLSLLTHLSVLRRWGATIDWRARQLIKMPRPYRHFEAVLADAVPVRAEKSAAPSGPHPAGADIATRAVLR